jgi:hypothetical protein
VSWRVVGVCDSFRRMIRNRSVFIAKWIVVLGLWHGTGAPVVAADDGLTLPFNVEWKTNCSELWNRAITQTLNPRPVRLTILKRNFFRWWRGSALVKSFSEQESEQLVEDLTHFFRSSFILTDGRTAEIRRGTDISNSASGEEILAFFVQGKLESYVRFEQATVVGLPSLELTNMATAAAFAGEGIQSLLLGMMVSLYPSTAFVDAYLVHSNLTAYRVALARIEKAHRGSASPGLNLEAASETPLARPLLRSGFEVQLAQTKNCRGTSLFFIRLVRPELLKF